MSKDDTMRWLPIGVLLLAILCVAAIIAFDLKVLADRHLSQEHATEQSVSGSTCHFAAHRAAAVAASCDVYGCGDWLERDLKTAAEICKQERLIRETLAQQKKLEQEVQDQKSRDWIREQNYGKRALPDS